MKPWWSAECLNFENTWEYTFLKNAWAAALSCKTIWFCYCANNHLYLLMLLGLASCFKQGPRRSVLDTSSEQLSVVGCGVGGILPTESLMNWSPNIRSILQLEVFFRWDVRPRSWLHVVIKSSRGTFKRVWVLTLVSWPNSNLDNYILPPLQLKLDMVFFTSCPERM